MPPLRCGARTPKDCLEDDVRPFLKQPALKPNGSYRARATCHDDKSVSGDLLVNVFMGRVTWKCFAGCPPARSRNALIMLGIRAVCLIRAAADLAADLDAIRAVIEGRETPARKVLLVAAILETYEELPRGRALEALAELSGITSREAYRARRAGLHP